MRGFLAALFVCFLASASFAASYYVSPVGSDSNPGTIDRPFRTFARANSLVAAGDTVNVRQGTYNEVVRLSKIGTSSAWIVFRSHPGETAVIDGAGSSANTSLVQITGQYIEFREFEVRNATRHGISVSGTKNVRVMSNRIHDSWYSGINLYSSSMGGVGDVLAEGNTVYNNCRMNQARAMSGGWPIALGASRAVRVTFRGNTVYQNYGEGIGMYLSDNGVIERNTAYDNFSVQIYLDNAQFMRVEGNFVYNSGHTGYYRNGSPSNGISMANETYGESNPLTDNLILNNIVIGAKRGITYGNYGNGGGLKNTTISNNTVYKATSALLNIDSDSHANSVVANNVFHQSGSAPAANVAGSGISYHHNSWYGGSAGTALGTGDVNSEPGLVNPGSFNPDDYKLKSVSPCLRKGASMSQVVQDHWGTIRTMEFDIGAHEASTSTGTDVGQYAIGVQNVGIRYRRSSSRNYYRPDVLIFGQDGRPVSGAKVTGKWSGALSGTYTATTGSDGKAYFSEVRTSSKYSVTFTVIGVTHSQHMYNSALNLETSATATLVSVP